MLDPLEMEIQIVVNHYVESENQTLVLWKNSHLNHWTPVFQLLFQNIIVVIRYPYFSMFKTDFLLSPKQDKIQIPLLIKYRNIIDFWELF